MRKCSIVLLIFLLASVVSLGVLAQGAKSFTEEELMRSNTANEVTFDLVYLNPLTPDQFPTKMVFQVYGSTHSGDLANRSYQEKIQVRTSDGKIADQVEWVWVQKSSHHPEAQLLVNKMQKDGQPLINNKTEYIEITIFNIEGVKERVFKWEKKDGLEYGTVKQ